MGLECVSGLGFGEGLFRVLGRVCFGLRLWERSVSGFGEGAFWVRVCVLFFVFFLGVRYWPQACFGLGSCEFKTRGGPRGATAHRWGQGNLRGGEGPTRAREPHTGSGISVRRASGQGGSHVGV